MGVDHQYLPGYQKISNPEILKKFSQEWENVLPNSGGYSAWDMHQKITKGKIINAIF